MTGPGDLNDAPLTALFRLEAEEQLRLLTGGLLALEQGDTAPLAAMMRAAHSLKGAARIVGLQSAVRLAHALEDALVAAQRGDVSPGRLAIDRLLALTDLLDRISRAPDATMAQEDAAAAPEVDAITAALAARVREARSAVTPPAGPLLVAGAVVASNGDADEAVQLTAPLGPLPEPTLARGEPQVVRASLDSVRRLVGRAGEVIIETRRLHAFGRSLARLKRLHRELTAQLEAAREKAPAGAATAPLREALSEAQAKLGAAGSLLVDVVATHENLDRRGSNLARQLYEDAMAVRMRPFADGTVGFPRLVRDLGRQLGKQVELEILGLDTQVDRDVLARMEAPLSHLLRNAVDHGIEPAAVRRSAGKPPSGRITLEARHHAGVLQISLADDGRGIEPAVLRQAVVDRKLVSADTAAELSEAELLEFLFLPGFSLAPVVTEISGRGVGLDVVQTAVREVRGSIRAVSYPGRGMRFELKMPVSLSVVRALVLEIAGEAYAVPLAFIRRTLRITAAEVAETEGRPHFAFEGRRMGLVAAQQVLGLPPPSRTGDVSVVVLGDAERTFGVAVDRFLGESELIVQPLDRRIGKVKDIAAGALNQDGLPVLIIDVADFIRSVEKIVSSGELAAVRSAPAPAAAGRRKRVLVVDDSLTVRELERKLLDGHGYAVEVAVDGMDGWNAIRAGHVDLVVADVDMPRLDGIELTRLIKQEPRLRAVPVIIVSYKDQPEHRQRGLDAGADFYLTKSSFNDATFIEAVADLIGSAEVPL